MAQTVIYNSPEVHEQNVVVDYPELEFGIVREVRVLCRVLVKMIISKKMN